MAKKKPSTFSDLAVFWIDILNSLIFITLVIPDVPWAYEDIQPHVGPRFSFYRYYSPLSANDNLGTMVPWMSWRTQVCTAAQQYATPNPLSLLGPLAVKAVIPGDSELEGGAALGCQMWPKCKEHVWQRCTIYYTWAITGIISCFLLISAAIACWVALVMMSQETQAKKKKNKMEFCTYVMYCQLAVFLMGLIATALYAVGLNKGIDRLQSTAYYPRPALYVGFYIACFAIFLSFLALVFAFFRSRKYVKREEEEQDPTGWGGYDAGYGYGGGAEYYGPADPNMPPGGYAGGYPPY